MRQTQNAKKFTKALRNGTHTPVNSGIFSDGDGTQKMDSRPKPSCGAKKPDGSIRAKAVKVPQKKIGRSATGKSAAAVAKYAK